jgi:protein SCO1/2
MKTILQALAFMALIAIAAACLGPVQAQPEFNLPNVTGHLPDLHFSLTDDTGNTVTEQNFRGHITLLYFGFTGCGSQCPLTLARLTSVIKALGEDAAKIHILLVSIDPEHDTPEKLRQYISAFDPNHMAGLIGNEQTISALAKSYRIAYRPDLLSADSPHGNAVYIFDKIGKARLVALPTDPDETLVHDLRLLISEIPASAS